MENLSLKAKGLLSYMFDPLVDNINALDTKRNITAARKELIQKGYARRKIIDNKVMFDFSETPRIDWLDELSKIKEVKSIEAIKANYKNNRIIKTITIKNQ